MAATPSIAVNRLVIHSVVNEIIGWNPLLRIHTQRRLHHPSPCQQVQCHTGGRRKMLVPKQMVGVRPLLARVGRKTAAS